MGESIESSLLETTIAFIQNELKVQKISLQALSNLTNISKDTICNILYHKTQSPSFENVASMVYALGGSLDDLAGVTRPISENEFENRALVSNIERGWMHNAATLKDVIAHERRTKICLAIGLAVVFIGVLALFIWDITHLTQGIFQIKS